jgi:hypothetical protein
MVSSSNTQRLPNEFRDGNNLILTEVTKHPITSFPLESSNGAKTYYGRSFFTALQIILTACLPPNQCFKEYLHIFLLLTMYLQHVLSSIKARHANIKVPRTTTLLVLCPSPNYPDKKKRFCSRATIGFSACGKETGDIIKDRRELVPELGQAKVKKGHGYCSEVATWCHLDEFVEIVQSRSEACEHVVAATVTLNLMTGKPEKRCRDCWKLIELVRKRYKFLRTLDITLTDPAQ